MLTKRLKWIHYPPPPPEFFEICGQLLRYCEKINPQRIKDTPPVNFFLCLVLASPISKKDFYKKQSLAYQKRHGCRRFQAAASFSSEKLVVGQRTRTYAVQHACGCFLYAPSIYSVYLQKRLLQRANSKSAWPISKKDFYKKQSSTYQKRHGCRRLHLANSTTFLQTINYLIKT